MKENVIDVPVAWGLFGSRGKTVSCCQKDDEEMPFFFVEMYGLDGELSSLTSCLFWNVWSSFLVVQWFISALSAYSGIYYYTFWLEGRKREKKSSHCLLNPYIIRFSERGKKLGWGEREKTSLKIACLSKLVFKDVSSHYWVSVFPKTWARIPNHLAPQKCDQYCPLWCTPHWNSSQIPASVITRL